MNVYVENDHTRQLSRILKDGGCPNYLVRINGQYLYFNPPETPELDGFWFGYDRTAKRWIKCTRTMNKWHSKVYDGLVNCFPDGIDGLDDYKSPLRSSFITIPYPENLKCRRVGKSVDFCEHCVAIEKCINGCVTCDSLICVRDTAF